MLKSFLKLRNDAKIKLILKHRLIRGCSINQINPLNLIDQNEDKKFNQNLNELNLKKADLKNESKLTKPTDERLTDKLVKCETLISLLQFIETNLFKLTDDQIILAYSKLNGLILHLNRTKGLNKYLDQSNRIIKASSSFKLLLNRSNESFNKFDTYGLLTILKTFQLIYLNPTNENVNQLVKLLRTRFNKIKLTQKNISNDEAYCLKIILYYLFKTNASDQLLKLQNELLKTIRNKLLNDQFDRTDIYMLSQLFFIFLNPEYDPNQEITIQLTKILLSPEIQLDLKQSVDLLHKLKKNYWFIKMRFKKGDYQNEELKFRYSKGLLYPKIIGKLIDKCNSVILKTLNSEPTNENFMFYLIKLDKLDNLSKEFNNFFDQNLLNSQLVPYCLQNFEQSKRFKYLVYNLVLNYSKLNIYDERLLKFIYDLYSTNSDLRKNTNICEVYYLFTKLRLPFVDQQNLAVNILFNFSDQFYSTMDQFRFNRLKVLTRLILNDVYDKKLYLYFDETFNFLDFKIYERMDFDLYAQTSLARVYLSMFSEMDSSLKQRIIAKLDRVINECPVVYKMSNNITNIRLSNIDNKLQANAYLSNGIYVDIYAIYDKSKKDLISLDQFKNYCFKIDQIPLTENEELIVFIFSDRIKGYMKEYENNYCYQLKKVLKNLKIRSIEVSSCKNLTFEFYFEFYFGFHSNCILFYRFIKMNLKI